MGMAWDSSDNLRAHALSVALDRPINPVTTVDRQRYLAAIEERDYLHERLKGAHDRLYRREAAIRRLWRVVVIQVVGLLLLGGKVWQG